MVRRYSFAAPRAIDRAMPFIQRSGFARRVLIGLPQSGLRRGLILSYIRWAYGRFNNQGELPRNLIADEMTFEQTAALLDSAGTFQGIEGVNAMVRELREAFGEIRFEPESLIELSSNRLLIFIRFSASGGGSGASATRTVAHELTLDGAKGKLVRFKVFWETSDALEAAGLSE